MNNNQHGKKANQTKTPNSNNNNNHLNLTPTRHRRRRRHKQQKQQEQRILKIQEIIERNRMINAIEALASLSITQSRKFYTYKSKYESIQKAYDESKNKNNNEDNEVVIIEKEEHQGQDVKSPTTTPPTTIEDLTKEVEDAKQNFYNARAQYLKEKDIREELSEEVQYLARKNNKVRKEKQKEIESRQAMLDEIRETFKVDTLNDNNKNERTKIVEKKKLHHQQHEEENDDNLNEHTKEHKKQKKQRHDTSIHHPDLHHLHHHKLQQGESTHEMESSRIKELETMITQLSYQLKQKDDHLNMILHHLNSNHDENDDAKVAGGDNHKKIKT